jgi:maleamate amidohydrolase
MEAEARRDSIYERASFGGRLSLGRNPGVLVVDFTCGFTDPESAFGADMTAEVEATRRVLDAAREKGFLITYTTVGYEPHLKDAGLALQKAPRGADLLVGSHWGEIDARLGAREEEPVILKKFPSAFFGTPMISILVSNRIDTVILCGAVTSGCIRATAIDLFSHGFPTLVPRDCVADRAQGPHEANLYDMNAKYVDVVTSEEAIAYMERLSAPAEAFMRV